MYKPSYQKREVIVFRQFQRKGYSLFACLGREVVISVLSVATLTSAKADSISDELWRVDSTEQAKTVWLSDVGVTGSRAPLAQTQAARMVTVLTRDEIQAAPVQSVNDLLKNAVGIDVRQRGALGSQTDISMRGGTQEQIIILLNGINICDPQTGHNVLDLPIQLSEIQRIEVLEGPAGRTYGTSSLVGAINIVTSPRNGSSPTTNSASTHLTLEGGSFGYAKAGFVTRLSALHQSPSTLHQSLSASYARSDGYSRAKSGSLNTDYSGSKIFYQGEYTTNGLRMSWHAGIADKGWGSSTFYASPRWQADDQYEHTTKLFTALQAEGMAGPLHIHPTIYWNQFRDRYEGYRGRPDLMPYNYNRCNVYGLSLNNHFDWWSSDSMSSDLQMRTAFGAEMRNEDLVSGNLGEPLFSPRHISGTDRDYTLGINRTNISAFAEHNILFQRLTLSFGFVAAYSSWSSMNMTVYPGADLSYRLLGHTPNAPTQLKLFASYNSSLRLPSFTEMYYKLQGYAADPHLKPEEMQAAELGAQLLTPKLQAKACVYYHHGSNMIDWIMDTSKGQQAEWQSVNHTRLNAIGLESSLTANFQQLLPTQHLLQDMSLSYSYMNQDKELEPNIVSQYALEYLRHKLVASLGLHLWRNLRANIIVRWQDRVGSYTDFDGNVCEYQPFALADARLTWTKPRYTLYAEANNLLNNTSYVDYGNVPQPGRWMIAGVSIRF